MRFDTGWISQAVARQFRCPPGRLFAPQGIGCMIAFMKQRDDADFGCDQKHRSQPERKLSLE